MGIRLVEASEKVRTLVAAIAARGEARKATGVGASGDETLLADKEAEDAIIAALGPLEEISVLSEEAGTKGERRAGRMAVIDPLDGSANFARGIPFYCTSVALSGGRSLLDVDFGLVRNLISGELYLAEAGKGATKDGKPIRTSGATDLGSSVVGVDMSRGSRPFVEGMARLVSSVKRQVHFGANALELCLVAEGKLDAFVDVRGRIRVTDLAAAYVIAKEAGATLSDANGDELNPSLTLGSGLGVVASATPALHRKILGML
jgi:myo-inositol-1(or 4)-monophosphatase